MTGTSNRPISSQAGLASIRAGAARRSQGASDRYAAARGAIDLLAEQISAERDTSSDATGRRLRTLIDAHGALCGLTSPPAIAETVGQIAARIAEPFTGATDPRGGDLHPEILAAVTRAVHAGIQAAWESWECSCGDMGAER